MYNILVLSLSTCVLPFWRCLFVHRRILTFYLCMFFLSHSVYVRFYLFQYVYIRFVIFNVCMLVFPISICVCSFSFCVFSFCKFLFVHVRFVTSNFLVPFSHLQYLSFCKFIYYFIAFWNPKLIYPVYSSIWQHCLCMFVLTTYICVCSFHYFQFVYVRFVTSSHEVKGV